MKIINDIHLGVARKAGTTLESQARLREYAFNHFERLLCGDKHIVINGDLFDRFTVETADLVRAYYTIMDWLNEDKDHCLTLICGNHDWSPKADKVSSFHALTRFLPPSQVFVFDHTHGLSRVGLETFCIPHMPNQDLFDLEIEKACTITGKFLLLHANYDNKFAEQADHSLNVSEAQADALIEAGWTLIFGHEHQSRLAKGGKVIVVGNQIPTSVADCLGPETKYFLSIDENAARLVPFLDINAHFMRKSWRNLDDVVDIPFTRIEGTATAEEAAEVVDAVASYRQRSPGLVITNAVKIDGLASFDKLAEMTMENISTFRVLDALCDLLTPEEGAKVRELIE